ncbi:Alanine racemase, N-terminal domain [Metamycoplasma cloacale]|uniref:Alanine/ornithine racemase family PLP-dependent enzyme n=1 Tax=Metamycoplasma cloacale TaxID=92401 RepID=A0A2Z4LLY6_9BACT|nr:alanine/ornithine racemase family PLP-dependent enzyme [Metamycoplasma cloacale]AWX42755.1 alanine/ornithine racemase family PLP-dependent enzyme [Metamycoplasma cloacale]VEU79430.1 Alanine racemase, N-terminal domain [Metamycoplasma cloacale]
MSFPKIIIDEKKFLHNIKVAQEICAEKGIEVLAVTKGFCGNRRMAELFAKGGIKFFGDSRLDNFEVYKDIKGHKQLLRLPQLDEIPRLVELCDSSLNSELETIKAISDYCLANNKTHEVIVMVDLGDRREGFLPEDTVEACGKIINEMKGVKLIGLGCNFGCYGGRIPSDEAMKIFADLNNEVQTKYNVKFSHISGGNSLSLHLVWENRMPKEVNILRMSFAMIFGTEDKYRKTIRNMHRDTFQCQAKVIEVKRKSSMPIGEPGLDAFGNIPTFEDIGDIDRVICAIGKIDTMFDAMIPLDKDMEILGGSSDHMIINVNKCKKQYKVGDIITFDLDWGSLLYLFNSSYVEKEFINKID